MKTDFNNSFYFAFWDERRKKIEWFLTPRLKSVAALLCEIKCLNEQLFIHSSHSAEHHTFILFLDDKIAVFLFNISILAYLFLLSAAGVTLSQCDFFLCQPMLAVRPSTAFTTHHRPMARTTQRKRAYWGRADILNACSKSICLYMWTRT